MPKLFLENDSPFKGFLILNPGETLEVKAEQTGLDYGTHDIIDVQKGNVKFFSGTLRVWNLPVEFLNGKGLVSKVMKELEFNSLEEAEAKMEELHAVVPRNPITDPDKGTVEAIINATATKLTQAVQNKAAISNAKVVKETPKVETKAPQVVKPQADQKAAPPTVNQLNVNTQQTSAAVQLQKGEEKRLSKKERKLLERKRKQEQLAAKQAQKAQEPIKQPDKKPYEKITLDNLKEHVNGYKKDSPANPPKITNQPPQPIKKAEAPKPKPKGLAPAPEEGLTAKENLKYKDSLGIMIVDWSKYRNGYFIGHIFKNSAGEPEAVIVFTPEITGMEDLAFPMVFINKETADWVYEAMAKHPIQKGIVGNCIVRPMSELDKELCVGDVALIQNGEKFINAFENEVYSTATP